GRRGRGHRGAGVRPGDRLTPEEIVALVRQRGLVLPALGSDSESRIVERADWPERATACRRCCTRASRPGRRCRGCSCRSDWQTQSQTREGAVEYANTEVQRRARFLFLHDRQPPLLIAERLSTTAGRRPQAAPLAPANCRPRGTGPAPGVGSPPACPR